MRRPLSRPPASWTCPSTGPTKQYFKTPILAVFARDRTTAIRGMRVVPPYVHMMMLAHARGAWRRVCLAQDGSEKVLQGQRDGGGDRETGPFIFRGAVQPPHPALRATFSPPGRRDSVATRRFLSKPYSLHETAPLAPSSPRRGEGGPKGRMRGPRGTDVTATSRSYRPTPSTAAAGAITAPPSRSPCPSAQSAATTARASRRRARKRQQRRARHQLSPPSA